MLDATEVLRKLAMTAARRSGLASAVRPLVAGAGVILMLHRVSAKPPGLLGMNRHLTITPAFLDELIGTMKATGYAFIDMDEAAGRLASGQSGGRFCVLTADDGYRDNLLEALPVVERHKVPFIIHVSPGLIDGTADLWWDILEELVSANRTLSLAAGSRRQTFDCSTPRRKRAAYRCLLRLVRCGLPQGEWPEALRTLAAGTGFDLVRFRRDNLLGWDDIASLARHPLVTIGAHTQNHFYLKRLGEDDARREIAAAAEAITGRTGILPRHMAFPFGDAASVGPREVRLAREAGFTTAVTTRHGVVTAAHGGHLHALPRISLNGRYQKPGYVEVMLSGFTTPLANAGRRVVTV